MSSERRRYFRINETIGITYHVINETSQEKQQKVKDTPDMLALAFKQDRKIEQLLRDISSEHPKVGELVSLLNQKLERIVGQLLMEQQLVDRIAHRVKEVNISACGLAFLNDEKINEGSRLKLELTLYPSELKISADGIVVGCTQDEDSDQYYWRIDFYGMKHASQEKLIQYIVQSQSNQLKYLRDGD